MNERSISQKQFHQALQACKKLSVQLEKDINEQGKRYNYYNSEAELGREQGRKWEADLRWTEPYRHKQSEIWQNHAQRDQVIAERANVRFQRAKAQKSKLEETIVIAENFEKSLKNTSENQELEDTAVKQDVYAAEVAKEVAKEVLLTQKINEIIHHIDPPFNYKKLPGIVAVVGGFSTIIGGFVIGGILLSVPVTIIPFFVGFAVALIGAPLWAWGAQSDPPELKAQETEPVLAKLNSQLTEIINNKTPSASVQSSDQEKVVYSTGSPIAPPAVTESSQQTTGQSASDQFKVTEHKIK